MSAINILDQAVKADMSTDDLLRSIDSHLVDLLRDGVNVSQSSLNDMKNGGASTPPRFSRDQDSKTTDNGSDKWEPSRRPRKSTKSASKIFDEFTDSIEAQLSQALFGAPIKDTVAKSLADFASDLGWSIDDLGKEAGKMVGSSLASAVKGTKWGQDISQKVSGFKDSINTQFNDILHQAAANLKSTGKDGNFTMDDLIHGAQGGSTPSDSDGGIVDNIIDASARFSDVSGVAEKLGSSMLNTESLLGTAGSNISGIITSIGEAGPTAASLGPMLSGLGSTVASAAVAMGPAILAVGAAAIALEVLSNAMGPAIEGFQSFADSVKNAANSAQDAEKKRNELAKTRMEADFSAMIDASFDVLEDATQHMLDSWDESLKTITATQGYTKEDAQSLIGQYAQRLRDEGLSSVVSVADINSNLAQVLQSGLSGAVAEEFAYQATLLNAAVPTENFFDYASTYASIAANAIVSGASQSEALNIANAELKEFASNLLYSSRELAGGFSTGLKNSSELLASATKIATSSRTGDVSDIAGVLTSVSAIVGAVAPDLASELINVVVDAATGGNSETTTALRSLAGTGASNTAFLTALAENPLEVFTTLFSNLSQLQTMSSDNFMEVADGLSQVFGVSRDAFARVDFDYLATAISQMNLNNQSLDQNMSLLIQGQTTSTAEQLRMQEINQIMIDEGLSYVLDNEAARVIQQNMWEEQRHMESLEATYAVDLKGGALDLLTGIKQTADNIVNFLNPFSWAKKVTNLVLTAQESAAMESDIRAMLEAGKVGNGSYESLYNLTTRGKELNLVDNYGKLLTGRSSFEAVATLKDKFWNSQLGAVGVIQSYAKDAVVSALSSSQVLNSASYGVSSKYNWDMVGKSLSKGISSSPSNANSSLYATISTSPSASLSSVTRDRVQSYLDTIQTFVDDNKSYEDWIASASNFGIANVADVLSDNGLTEQDVQSYFTELEAQKASEYEHERDLMESKMWEDAIKWYEETWPLDEETLWGYQDSIIDLEKTLVSNTDTIITNLIRANESLKEFYNQWVDYYVEHTAYSRDTLNAYDVAAIRNAEKGETGDAVLSLAQALTSNMVNLKDPTVQTNVLLSQILIIVEAIMQQKNNTTDISLPTALSALGLGVTNT